MLFVRWLVLLLRIVLVFLLTVTVGGRMILVLNLVCVEAWLVRLGNRVNRLRRVRRIIRCCDRWVIRRV